MSPRFSTPAHQRRSPVNLATSLLGTWLGYGREWTAADADKRRAATKAATLSQSKRAAPAKPSPPPGAPVTGSRAWGKALITRYGQTDGVDYMQRELSLADAAKEHRAKLAQAASEREADFIKTRDRLDAEIAAAKAELARRERRQGKGVRFAQSVCRPFGKHPQRPGGPDRPAA